MNSLLRPSVRRSLFASGSPLRSLPIRRTTTTPVAPTPNPTPVRHLLSEIRPPLPVRVLTVGLSVGLATPLYTIAGVFRVWSNVLPKTPLGKSLKVIAGMLLGGGAVTLVYEVIGPLFLHYPDLLLPFALANSAACMIWYGAAEMIFGLEALSGTLTPAMRASLPSILRALLPLSVPIGGPVIGALTALTAPLLWPIAFRACWDAELYNTILGVSESEQGTSWVMDAYYSILLPVGLPVGIVSGLSMHMLLKPVVMGVPSIPWTLCALPVLATVIGAGALYFRRGKGTASEFLWQRRLDPLTGCDVSYNVRTRVTERSFKHADAAAVRRLVLKGGHAIRHPMKYFSSYLQFDDPEHKDALVLYNTPITPQNIDSHTVLYGLIDMLVRYKYLDLQLHNAHVNEDEGKRRKMLAEKRALEEHALSAFGIRNIENLYHEAAAGCIAARQLLGVDITDSELPVGHPKYDYQGTLDTVKKRLCSWCLARPGDVASSRSIERGKHALDLLAVNLNCLEKELLDKIHFRLSPAEEKHLLTSYLEDRQWEKWTEVATWGGVLAGGVALLAFGVKLASQQ